VKTDCNKCLAIHRRGGNPAWGPFFFVCGAGHVTSLENTRDQLSIVPNMNAELCREALSRGRHLGGKLSTQTIEALRARLRYLRKDRT